MRVLTRLSAAVASAALAVSLSAVPATAFSSVAPSGIDVSGHQRGHGEPIDWQEVAAHGQKFAFVKATEGETWTNEHYLEDVRAANDAGLLVGTYHYARPAGDPRLQAAHYAATLAASPQHALPPVLDIEVNEGRSPEELQRWVGEFLATTEQLTGRTPMVYTYRYFWREHLADTDQFTRHPLWLAAYQNHAPEPVGGWNHLTFWQRSETGRVPGINGNVDLNLFNGNEAQLGDFAAGAPVSFGTMADLVTPDNDVLTTLGGDNAALAGLILAAQTGFLPQGTLENAARDLGIDPILAGGLTGRVSELIATDSLPVEDLRVMVDNPDYSIGDLLILLANAG